jgi:hypothetical protein
MIATSSIKNFESGYLGLGTSTTGTSIILGLQSGSVKFKIDTQEITTFESNFSKQPTPTYTSWTIECKGIYLNLSGDTYHQQSGDTRSTGGVAAKVLFALTKARSTNQRVTLKLGAGDYHTGSVLLTDYSIDFSAGDPMTFNLSMIGTSDLVPSAT